MSSELIVAALILCAVLSIAAMWFYKHLNKGIRDFSDRWTLEAKHRVAYLLKKGTEVCSGMGMKLVLFYGSLLGYVRHHRGLIPWDDDVDVVLISRISPNLTQIRTELSRFGIAVTLQDWGFKLSMLDQPVIPGCQYSWPFVDVFFSTLKAKDDIYISWYHEEYSANLIFPLQEGQFLGVDVNIPNRPMEVLHQNYGKRCLIDCVAPSFSHKEERFTGYDQSPVPCSVVLANF